MLSYTKHLILQIFITFHRLDLRFLLKSLLLRTKCPAVSAESVLYGVLGLAVSDPELTGAGCLLPASSHRTQKTGGGSSMSVNHSRSLTSFTQKNCSAWLD